MVNDAMDLITVGFEEMMMTQDDPICVFAIPVPVAKQATQETDFNLGFLRNDSTLGVDRRCTYKAKVTYS